MHQMLPQLSAIPPCNLCNFYFFFFFTSFKGMTSIIYNKLTQRQNFSLIPELTWNQNLSTSLSDSLWYSTF